jgi:serine/threonine protein kinase
VSLYEVLDDPDEDSLYMVLEMCKKGVVMKVGLDERAEPYKEEACRCWFRDMILGIEYLHAQGVVHRDIKPDNCLITNDDVLKIVDFGVSEMFEKASDMATAKSAGSPAFMPPELCVAKHGQVSGRAADIWSMGVTLFCLRYGHIPFEKHGMLELYESIRGDELHLENEQDQSFADLMHRLLEKDPEKRITMPQLRVSGQRSHFDIANCQLTIFFFLGTPLGDTEWQGPIVACRGELLGFGRASYTEGNEPCNHKQHGQPDGSNESSQTFQTSAWPQATSSNEQLLRPRLENRRATPFNSHNTRCDRISQRGCS